MKTIVPHYSAIATKVDIFIITNTSDYKVIEEALIDLPETVTINFVTPSKIGHPYFLTWIHREILQELVDSVDFSHFLYTEDDLLLSYSNVMYWLRYREPLQQHGLIPSFFRVEVNSIGEWISTDCTYPISFTNEPKLLLDYCSLFMNMPNPYQGMYFLDRSLVQEFICSPAMSPDFGPWNIREKAAQGLTFVNIPKGCYSRNFVLVDLHRNSVSRDAWIHHLLNNYANDENTPFGKVLMSDFFDDEDGVWIEGSFYSIRYDDNSFVIIKILKVDLQNVHACVFSRQYDQRPTSKNELLINAGQEGEPPDIEYMCFIKSFFAVLQAQFIQWEPVSLMELNELERNMATTSEVV